MVEKRLAPVYADRVIAARARDAADEERAALADLEMVCRRAGAPTSALLSDARRRAALGVTAVDLRPSLALSG